jgi:outer membrane protein TolC
MLAAFLQHYAPTLKMEIMTQIRRSLTLLALTFATLSVGAQEPQSEAYHGQALSLNECRQMAVQASKTLEQARIETEMAGYDRKIARANYFPKISATGLYLYNNRDVALINDDQSNRLRNAGTNMENAFWDYLQSNIDNIEGDISREAATRLLESLRNNPNMPSIAAPINAIGQEIDAALHPNLHNIWVGAITLQQPVFVGGKIIYSNQMAVLAQELSEAQYDLKESEILLDVDQAYWQIISIANKKKLAQSYTELLEEMEKDVQTAVNAGVSTESDLLQVRVKANEARMMLTKATNGLTLSKMLLCKRIGIPLDSNIVLVDETLEVIPEPGRPVEKSLEDIYESRPETRSLTLATKIFDKKAKVVRADLMPTVALMGAFTVSNPNIYNGFQNNWRGGNLTAGVMVKIPITHGGEAIFKYKKAKAEARLYQDQLDDAKEMITLQVTQQRKLFDEALQKVEMTRSNLELAEDNLRSARVGLEAGVIATNTVLGAHTAWLSAHSEYIDAGIELQMTAAALRKAEGGYRD